MQYNYGESFYTGLTIGIHNRRFCALQRNWVSLHRKKGIFLQNQRENILINSIIKMPTTPTVANIHKINTFAPEYLSSVVWILSVY